MPKSLKIALGVLGILFIGIPVLLFFFGMFFIDSVQAKDTLKEKVAALKTRFGMSKTPKNLECGTDTRPINKHYKLKEDYIFYGRDELNTILTFKKDTVIHGFIVQLNANSSNMGNPVVPKITVVDVKDFIQLYPNKYNATIPLSVLAELTKEEYEAWYRTQPVV